MKTMKTVVCLLALSCCLLSVLGCTFLGISSEAKERRYYLDKSNFSTVTASCVNCGYYSHPSEKYYYAIDFENAEYERTDEYIFQNVTFRIDKYSAEILKEHGIEKKLKPGVTFTCISAPIYLNNSYDCPIVALEIDGEVLLDFETGYNNLLKTYGVSVP